MNSTMTTEAGTVERLHADHGVTKRLGRWTCASQFDIRARKDGGYPTVDDPTRAVR